LLITFDRTSLQIIHESAQNGWTRLVDLPFMMYEVVVQLSKV
ncbi:uncharacterized protein METZ01_LOCUS188052, partial [marine metagenome]